MTLQFLSPKKISESTDQALLGDIQPKAAAQAVAVAFTPQMLLPPAEGTIKKLKENAAALKNELPPRTFETQAVLDSRAVQEARKGIPKGVEALSSQVSANSPVDRDLFLPKTRGERPLFRGRDFESFLAGESPEFSGTNAKQAAWINENSALLAQYSIEAQVEGDRFLIRNSSFSTQPLDQSLFDESGMKSKPFESFIGGVSPALEGDNRLQARWIQENEQALTQNGIHAYVEVDNKGEATGRFTLQNLGFLPRNISSQERDAIGRSLEDARSGMETAELAFTKAEQFAASRSAEDQAKARSLAKDALGYMDRAQALYGAITTYVESKRSLYAREAEIKGMPASGKLLDESSSFMADSLSARSDTERIVNIRNADFLLHYLDANLYLKKTRDLLPADQRSEIAASLNDAVKLFNQKDANSFERAYFIVGQTHSLMTILLERAGAQAQYDAVRKTVLPEIELEKLPLFQTGGVFDKERFKSLTGVSIEEFKAGTKEAKAGIPNILAKMYAESLGHYDDSLSLLRSTIAHAVQNAAPDNGLVNSNLEEVQKQREAAMLSFVRTAQLDPVFGELRNISNIVGHLPSKEEVAGLHLSPEGMKELLDSRNTLLRSYRQESEALSGAFLYLMAAQNSQGEARKGFTNQAQGMLVSATRQGAVFMRSAKGFNEIHGKTAGVVSYITSLGISGEESAVYGQDLMRIAKEHLQEMQKNPSLVRKPFLEAVTNPRFMPELPHREELLGYIEHLGGVHVLQSLYDENASPAVIDRAIGDVLNAKFDVIDNTRVSTRGGMGGGGVVYIRGSHTLEELLASDNPHHDEWRDPELLARLKELKENPSAFNLDERRDILLKVIKKSGPVQTRALESIERYMNETFAEAFDSRIQDLYYRGEKMPGLAQDIQNDVRFIMLNLQPSGVEVIREGKMSRIEFKDPKVQKAYERLMQNVGEVHNLPSEMAHVIPNFAEGLSESSREIPRLVAQAESNYQEQRDEQERRMMWIAGGATLGLLAAAPFTGGQSLWGMAGVVGTGVGVGMAVPSLVFTVEDYRTLSSDPKATLEQKNKAWRSLWYEVGLNSVMLLPVVGHATRAWAIGRGALALARLGAGMEVAGGIGMVGFGAYQGYEGVEMMREGHTGWGLFNAGMGALFMFGGAPTAIGGMRSWSSISRLSKAMISPEAIAKDITQLDSGMALAQRARAGKQVEFSAERFNEMSATAKRLENIVGSGVKLTPEQQASFNAFRSIFELQPLKDAKLLSRFSNTVGRKGLVSADDFLDALAAQDRLNSLTKVRSLSIAESQAVKGMESAVRAQQARDISALDQFGKIELGEDKLPLHVRRLAAKSAFDRIAISIERAGGTATEEQLTVLRQYRVSMNKIASFTLKNTISALSSEANGLSKAAENGSDIARAVIRSRLVRGTSDYFMPGEAIAGYRLKPADIEGEILALGRDYALTGQTQQIRVISADKSRLNTINDLFGREAGNIALDTYRQLIREGVTTALQDVKGVKALFVRTAESGDEVNVYLIGRNVEQVTPEVLDRSLKEATRTVAARVESAVITADGRTVAQVFDSWLGSKDVGIFVKGDFNFSDPVKFSLKSSTETEFLADLVNQAEHSATFDRVAKATHLREKAVSGIMRDPEGVYQVLSDVEIRAGAVKLAGGEEPFAALPKEQQVAYIRESRSRITFDNSTAVDLRYRITDPQAEVVIKNEQPNVKKALPEALTNSHGPTGLNSNLGHPHANVIYNARNDAITDVIKEGLPNGIRIKTAGKFGPMIIEGGTEIERSLVLTRIVQKGGASLAKLAEEGQTLALDFDPVTLFIREPMNYDSISSALTAKRLGIEQLGVSTLTDGTYMVGFVKGPPGLRDFAHLDALSDSVYSETIGKLNPASKAKMPTLEEFGRIRSMIQESVTMRNGEGLLLSLRDSDPQLYGKLLTFLNEKGTTFVNNARLRLGLPLPEEFALPATRAPVLSLSERGVAEIQASVEKGIQEGLRGIAMVDQASVTVNRGTASVTEAAGEFTAVEKTQINVELMANDGRLLGIARWEISPTYNIKGEQTAYLVSTDLNPAISGAEIEQKLSTAVEESLRNMGIQRVAVRASGDALVSLPAQGYSWVEAASELSSLERNTYPSLTWSGSQKILDTVSEGKKAEGLFTQWRNTPEGAAWKLPQGQSIDSFLAQSGENLGNYPSAFVSWVEKSGVENIQTRFLAWAKETGWTGERGMSADALLSLYGNHPSHYPEDFLIFLGSKDKSMHDFQSRFMEWAQQTGWKPGRGERVDIFIKHTGESISLYPQKFLSSLGAEVPYTKSVVMSGVPSEFTGLPTEYAHLLSDPKLGRQIVQLLRSIDEVNGSTAGVYLAKLKVGQEEVRGAVKVFRKPISIQQFVRSTQKTYQKYQQALSASPSNWTRGAAFTKDEIKTVAEVLSRTAKGMEAQQAISKVGSLQAWGDQAAYFVREAENAKTLSSLGIGPRFLGYVDVGKGNMAFAMEHVVGVDRYDIGIKQLDEIATLNGITRGEQVQRTLASVEKLETTLATKGYRIADFQYAVLTKPQKINGAWREAGEAVLWDAGGMTKTEVPMRAALQERVSKLISKERQIFENRIAGNYFAEGILTPDAAINEPAFQEMAMTLTNRQRFDIDTFAAFVQAKRLTAEQRSEGIMSFISKTIAADTEKGEKLFDAIRQLEKESGIVLLPREIKFEQLVVKVPGMM